MDLIQPLLDFAAAYPVPSFIAFLFAIIFTFGKRMESRFDLEAEFYDANNREVAEFETKSSRVAKSDEPYQFYAKFKWYDASLSPADDIEVFLDDELILKGTVSEAGRVRLGRDEVQKELTEAHPGQICRVLRNQVEVLKKPVQLD